jgi:DnaK suppressor protein
MMPSENKEYFKNLLTEKLNGLSAEVNSTTNEMTESNEKIPDPNDRATAESDANLTLSIWEREMEIIAEIYEALERIENDIYGICEECGEEIFEGRLKAAPETTSIIFIGGSQPLRFLTAKVLLI